MININDIEKQVQAAITQKIETELNTYDLYPIIEQQINFTIQEKVNATITGLLNRLITSESVSAHVDARLSNNIQEKLDLAVKSRVAQTVSQIDVGTEISNRIVQFVQERMQKTDLPKNIIPAHSIIWDDFVIPAEKISAGTIQNFSSSGIEDQAVDVNLTVLDGQVVIENETVTKHLTVVDSANIKNLSVGRLVVNDGIIIKDGNFSEQIKNLVDSRIAAKRNEDDHDLNGKPLLSNRMVLINSNSLGNSIVESNLRKVGRLNNLTVTGETDLAETVYINNNRMGLNTDEPAGVFTAWDEESEISIRKYKNRTMYIGSTRDSELVIGVAGDAVLNVRKTGVEVNSIKVGNINISSGIGEPDYRGSPGDLVINESTRPGQPWAWRCVGGEQWLPLK
jgi:hypothetical protein